MSDHIRSETYIRGVGCSLSVCFRVIPWQIMVVWPSGSDLATRPAALHALPRFNACFVLHPYLVGLHAALFDHPAQPRHFALQVSRQLLGRARYDIEAALG